MAGMKDSGVEWIGKIPEGWEQSKLNKLGNYINGYAFKPDDWGDIGKPIIRIQDLTGTNDNPNYYNGNLDEKYLVKKNDILISWAATLDAFIWKGEESWLNQHIFKVEPNADKVDSGYFYWLMKIAMENMNNDNKHGIVMQHVTTKMFGNFVVPLPPLAEQRKIAKYLDEKIADIDEIIDKTKVTIEDYKKYRQAVITGAVTKGIHGTTLVDSRIVGLGQTRKDARILKYKYVGAVRANLVNVYTYLDFPQVSPDKIEKGSGRLISVCTVEEAGVVSDNHLFHKGMIVYSKVRPMLNKVIIADFDGLCSADMYPIESFINTKYLLYYMLSNAFLNQLAVTDNRVKMPKLNKEELSEISVIVPNETEQGEIAAYLDKNVNEINELISSKEKFIEEMEKYKRALIYEYVTGKKVIS